MRDLSVHVNNLKGKRASRMLEDTRTMGNTDGVNLREHRLAKGWPWMGSKTFCPPRERRNSRRYVKT